MIFSVRAAFLSQFRMFWFNVPRKDDEDRVHILFCSFNTQVWPINIRLSTSSSGRWAWESLAWCSGSQSRCSKRVYRTPSGWNSAPLLSILTEILLSCRFGIPQAKSVSDLWREGITAALLVSWLCTMSPGARHLQKWRSGSQTPRRILGRTQQWSWLAISVIWMRTVRFHMKKQQSLQRRTTLCF